MILPSLLAADLGSLASEISRAAGSGADALHIDVMDAHFVPNLSFGPEVVSLARRVAPAFWRHVHLMMTRPDRYIDAFADAGAQTIQIHVECEADIRATLKAISARNVRPALVVNPETPVEKLFPYLGDVDEFLVMTVHPGYGGQKFISGCLAKIASLRQALDAAGRANAGIMVDGGINLETARLAAQAGANMFVAGSFLFHQNDMAAAIAAMRNATQPAIGK